MYQVTLKEGRKVETLISTRSYRMASNVMKNNSNSVLTFGEDLIAEINKLMRKGIPYKEARRFVTQLHN